MASPTGWKCDDCGSEHETREQAEACERAHYDERVAPEAAAHEARQQRVHAIGEKAGAGRWTVAQLLVHHGMDPADLDSIDDTGLSDRIVALADAYASSEIASSEGSASADLGSQAEHVEGTTE